MTNIKDNPGHSLISAAAKRSGVKTELIRAWERRYQAVTPTRTAGGHRVYSDLDVARLALLNQATSQGHSIGRIAHYSLEDLRNLLHAEAAAPPSNPLANLGYAQSLAASYLDRCYEAVLAFDAGQLESHFEHALVELGVQHFVEELLEPLLNLIGERWRCGELRPVHEHMASSIIRSLSYILRNNAPRASGAPHMVVTTPLGQLHELGALLAAIIAELKGWKVTYLGANLPAEEIAAAVKFTAAQAVTISISFNNDDIVVQKELRRLRILLGKQIALIVGGRSASHYEALLNEVGVVKIESLAHFRHYLDELANRNSDHPVQAAAS